MSDVRFDRAPSPRYRMAASPWIHGHMLREVLSGALRRGPDVERFETAFAAFVGAPEAVAMPMCRVAIHRVIAHYAADGDVLMSPYTIVDVVNMVLAAGARPVFVDVDPVTCAIDPAALAARFTPRTRAVLVTHLHGIAADIRAISRLCAERGVPLIEDVAQALGGAVDGRRLGAWGDAGVFSFGTFKNVNTGFGGMVTTRDPALAAALRAWLAPLPWFSTRSIVRKLAQGAVADALAAPAWYALGLYRLMRHGVLHDVAWINRLSAIELDTRRRESLPGYYLGRYTPGQARAALRQLPAIDADADARVAAAAVYHAGLGHLSGAPPGPKGRENVYTYYPFRAARRRELLRWLMAAGRDVAPQHLHAVCDLPPFQAFGACPVASRVAREVVLLPTWPGYGADDLARNVRVIVTWYDRGCPDWRA